MYKYLAIISILAVAGCSSTPDITYQEEQAPYCTTEETVVNTNGNVSSQTRLECSDKPKVHHLSRDIGVAGMCRSYEKQVVRPNGQNMSIRGVMCRDKITGKWIPADPNLSY
jgi:hypothetical protein